MERSTIQWTISIPPLLSRAAMKTAKAEFRTRSELVREALRRYLENRTVDRIRAKVGRRLRTMGVTTESDIERMIDEDRV